MKTRVLIGLAVLVAAIALVASAQQKRLNLFIWSEYIDPAVIKTFEKNTGAKVVTTLYESNEDMLAKLQAGGTKQYDIIVPSGYIVPVLLKQNLLRPLDATKIPNLKNLSERFRKVDFDSGNKYTVAYLWGTSGIGYRKDKFKGTPDSWAIMFD